MIYRISKKEKTIQGSVKLTPSKSISNRVLLIRALCNNEFQVFNSATANDTLLLKNLLSSDSKFKNAEDAGTTFRFLAAYLALQPGEWLLTGTERMKMRPVEILVDALRKLGSKIIYTEKENFPPLKITGATLKGGSIEIDGSLSSQFVSSLLMIAPTLENGLKLKLLGAIASMPYVEMTLKLMGYFGIRYAKRGMEISIDQQKYKPRNFTVENDWSAASYWYSMAALSANADLTLEGLDKDSIQGDSAIATIMKPFGIETTFYEHAVRITKKQDKIIHKYMPLTSPNTPHPLQLFSQNFLPHPDLVQSIAVTCAASGIEAQLSGIQNLRHKETDRLLALQNELKKIGVETKSSDSVFQILDLKKLHTSSSPFQTYNDHRMAMSFAALALKFGEVEIENPEVVKKSYPEFWDDLKSVGFEVKEI